MVDGTGAPRVVFHGTTQGPFAAFRPSVRKGEQLGFGIHFAEDRDLAARYATDPEVARKGRAPHVFEVYLSVRAPLLADALAVEGTPAFDLARKLAGPRLFTQKDVEGRRTVWVQNAIDSTSPRARRAADPRGGL